MRRYVKGTPVQMVIGRMSHFSPQEVGGRAAAKRWLLPQGAALPRVRCALEK